MPMGPLDSPQALPRYWKGLGGGLKIVFFFVPKWSRLIYIDSFYTAIWLIFFDLDFSDVTGIEFHGDSESAISFVI